MTQKLFLLAISINLLIASCHDNFRPNSFEEPNDELVEFIEEFFLDKNISFFPTKSYKNLKLKKLENNLTQATITITEPIKLNEISAFNNFNDLVGNLFYDYDIEDFTITFKPYEARVVYKSIYLGVSVEIKGIKGDLKDINRTTAKISFINYTKWVKEYLECKDKR